MRDGARPATVIRRETTVSTVIPPPPSDRAAALSELRSLGRRLDRQVTECTGGGEREVEATLRLMKQVHAGIVAGVSLDA
jgi:hypothetical protein